MNAADVAASLLAAAAAALDDPPARRLLTVGAPTDPLEGEQVAVGFSRFFTGLPGQPQGGPDASCWGPLVAEYVVRVLRCFPTSTNTADSDPAAVAAAARRLIGDGENLRAALRDWQPTVTTSQGDVWVGDVVGFRPQGLAHALSVTVHVLA